MDQTDNNQFIDNEQENGNRLENRTVFRGVQSVVGTAILIATILTLWNPHSVFRTPNIEDLFRPTTKEEEFLSDTIPEEIHIGILAGHWQNSPGEVCADGRTEHDVNYGIAYQLELQLEGQGYKVDFFPEFDERLFNYDESMLIAIYSGSCAENPYPPSGFRIGTSLTAENLEQVNNLSVCLAEIYQEQTGLPFSYDVIDPDHASYHIFRDVSSRTPAIRFEIGTLSTDHDLIFNQSGKVVQALVDGITCYLNQSQAGN